MSPADPRDDDALQLRRYIDTTLLQQCARPQRIRPVIDDLAIQLLPSEPRAGIARHHIRQECRRQVKRIRRRRCARHRRAGIGEQTLEQCAWTRRRCNQLLWLVTQPQSELQHIERGLRLTPFRHLVRPCTMKLRPTQALGILRGKHFGDRAIRPFQPPARWRP